MSRLRTLNDIRFDPFAATQGSTSITGEAHTVADTGLGFYGIRLYEVPLQDDPSSITIAGYTEVTVAPASGEFQVDYTYKSGYIKFNAADDTNAVTVNYKGTGSPVEAEIINEHRTQATIDHPDGSVTTAKLAADCITEPKVPDATKLDIRQQSGQELVMEVRTSDPGSPSSGAIWLRSDI